MTPLDELWSLDGRTAIVTGAAQGFGAAIARRVAEAGASVVIADLRQEGAEATAKRITDETGSACTGLPVNVADEDSVTELFAAAEALYGPVDVLVNNAGVFSNCYAPEMSVQEWSRIIDINVTGTFLCSRAAARSMSARRQGVIINVASVDALASSSEGMVHYTTSKHAIAGFTKSLAMELALSGVRVNAVCPGAAMTEGTVEFISAGAPTGIDIEAQWDGIVAHTPLGRLLEPDEIGRAVVFLASDMASFVTGVLLPVDGGILVQPLEGYVGRGDSG